MVLSSFFAFDTLYYALILLTLFAINLRFVISAVFLVDRIITYTKALFNFFPWCFLFWFRCYNVFVLKLSYRIPHLLLVVARELRLVIWIYTLILGILMLGLSCGCFRILLPVGQILVLRLHVYLMCTVVALGRLFLMRERSVSCILSLVWVAWWLGIRWEWILLESLYLVGIF